MISFVQGNILASNADALVNPINCTPAMGKGLALQFRNAIPGLYQAHQAAAKAGLLAPGKLHLFFSPTNRKTVIGLPTKRDWRDPSRIEDVESGLKALVELTQSSPALKSIAIPPLGCGLGGLRWSSVRSLAEAILGTCNSVHLIIYEPSF